MTSETASINFPIAALIEQVAPLVEERLEAKFAERKIAENKRRSKIDAFEAAIEAVLKASERVEKSRNSRSEPSAITALISAAAGLRSARLNYRKGL
jgi:hypothetical protein